MPRSSALHALHSLLVAGLALAACGGDDVAQHEDAAIHVDLGADDGVDRAERCVVVCQYFGPGEYRTECRAADGLALCEVDAYPVCDVGALPGGFDGGVFPAPVCLRPDTSEVRVPACAVDGDGLPLLTEPPVVRCVAVE